ncbi:multisubunit Na+/H+ antiporter MnhE subunit [Streptomyces sp. SAI-133]|uniref:hypothetical protein n=1 Tax=unclassified Streptomyces TaxID=2593676 RepID=UPI0024757CFC|nr:hypothetical protein [Streptomyces sp. SAI-133]MDH6590077.1 multisubunit Na+/H+ antiporter MnhE subunit [Streptomyces sp. SAI-133]
MDPATVTAGLGAAAAVSRLAYIWLSAHLHRRRVQEGLRRDRERQATLLTTISELPPGTEITEVLPDGRRITVKLPRGKAA